MLAIDNNFYIDIIQHPIITDKTTKLIEENQYSFTVNKKSNKLEIKKSIEYIFKVRVKHINTCNSPPKKKRVGKFIGKKTSYKKAIITLHEGYNINIFPED